MTKVVYIERRPGPFVSIEKVFRQIAANLPETFETKFQALPFGWKVFDTIRNLIFFRPKSGDLYHVTGHVHYITLRLPPERTILSVMDVRFVILKRGIRRRILKKLYLDWPIRRMRYVTSISQRVKDEIVELTGCDPEKIRVLDLPLLSHLEHGSPRPFNRVKPKILQIGTMTNKNVPRLAEALRGIECSLVIVGELDSDQVRWLNENSIEFENYVAVPDEKIRELYETADMVTFCSTYEGFGLPIIEAQAMRKPIVTSDIEPLRSVAGEGACLVEPLNVGSIREGILLMIQNNERRKEVVEAGLQNVKRFDSERVSAQYAELYDEVMDSLR